MISVHHLDWRAIGSDDLVTIQVGSTEERVAAVQAAWAAGLYTHVADVDSNSLDTAWMRTNTIEQPWTVNQGISVKAKDARSSSVGDVFVQGPNYHIADMIGFVEVTGLKLSGK